MLLSLVKKPYTMGHITQWMPLLLEFDFIDIIYKGSKHVLVDRLSRVPNGEPPMVVKDDLLDTLLFQLDLVPKWVEEIKHFLANSFPQEWPLNMDIAHELLKDVTPY